MKRRYNFTSTFVDSNSTWGILTRGKWTGLIGQVHYEVSLDLWLIVIQSSFNLFKKTDFGMCVIARTKERLTAVDFTDFVRIDQMGFLSQRPSRKKYDLLFTDRISPTVWMCTFVSFGVMSALLYIMARVYHRLKHLKKKRSFGSIVVKLCAIYLKQCKLYRNIIIILN